MLLNAGDIGAELGQAGGQVATASADLENRFSGLRKHALQDAPGDDRLQHHFAMAQRQRHVGESDLAIRIGDKLIAVDGVQRRQDAQVEHVPGADLVVDHVGSGQLDTKGHHGTPGSGSRRGSIESACLFGKRSRHCHACNRHGGDAGYVIVVPEVIASP